MNAEKASALAERIEKFDVPAEGYERGPSGKNVFILSLYRGNTVKVWPGVAEVTVRGSSARRQVVINVFEARRRITHLVKVPSLPGYVEGASDDDKQGRLRRRFPVQFPDGDRVRWSYKDIKWEPDKATNYGTLSGTVTATVPQTRQSFLVGYDENALFVSMLPEAAESVKDAHEILRPSGIDERALRQGEWFFQPVAKKTAEELDKRVAADPSILDDSPEELGSDSSHYASQALRHKGRLYAIGWVTDRRYRGRGYSQGKSSHHTPLFLTDWHLVVRNREVVPENQTPSRSWD